ncbi:hypothetical protein LCGC14_3032730, partial [marine sediment metagenome]
PPYHENPFAQIDVERIPIEDAKPFVDLTDQQERALLEACDDWQFPIFATLFLTGLRPGELTHLLLPDDMDLDEGWLWVRNKPDLGWQVKTRNERSIPLVAELVEVLRIVRGRRGSGTLFSRRRFWQGDHPPLAGCGRSELQAELDRRAPQITSAGGESSERVRRQIATVQLDDQGSVLQDQRRGGGHGLLSSNEFHGRPDTIPRRRPDAIPIPGAGARASAACLTRRPTGGKLVRSLRPRCGVEMVLRRNIVVPALCSVAAMMCFGGVPVFLKHLAKQEYNLDSWTVNAVRYGVATLFWLPFVVVLGRRSRAPRAGQARRSIWVAAIVPAIPNLIGQVGWALCPYNAEATTIGFVIRTS